MKHWLVGILTASLIINALLIQHVLEMSALIKALQLQTQVSPTQRHSKSSLHSIEQTPYLTQDTGEKRSGVNQFNTEESQQQAQWDRLQQLRGANQYEELLYEIQLYLREYPQSIEGIMLEAEAIYYTQPLNAAIIHYYALRELELPFEQRQQVDKFIEIHSSRTIQQFSGGANWSLLAAFLEPLIQVDPTNRNYLLSLAKSYGMEQQYSLMEDTLAALPAEDPRAQRLRDSIYHRNQNNDSPLVSTASTIDRLDFDDRTMVQLINTDNKLLASVSLNNRALRLLVDTGASMTALRLSLQSQIAQNSEFLGIFNVQTAGGLISSPMYKVKQLTLGGNTLSDITVMLLEDNNLGEHDGLLGMNVLAKYDFITSNLSGDVFLRKK